MTKQEVYYPDKDMHSGLIIFLFYCFAMFIIGILTTPLWSIFGILIIILYSLMRIIVHCRIQEAVIFRRKIK